jgi:hypothetical protein
MDISLQPTLDHFLELLRKRLTFMKTLPPATSAKAPEPFLHEETDDRKKVFSILGKVDPSLANNFAIALHSITGEKAVFKNLLVSLIVEAKDWSEKDRQATYRVVAGLWVKHNAHTKREIESMVLERTSNALVIDFVKFIRDTKHPLFMYVKDMLPPMD